MAWIEPKINWTIDDYFNASDYNRIIENINELKTMADELFIVDNFRDMGEKKNAGAPIYAREFSLIEDNLSSINKASYKLNTDFKTYRSNWYTPDYKDLNRIESVILDLYKKMVEHKNNLVRLPFTFGNQRGIRV